MRWTSVRLTVERLVREDNLSVPQAVVTLLWMDVELDPQPVEDCQVAATHQVPDLKMIKYPKIFIYC